MGWETRQLASICEVFADGDWIESKAQSETGVRLIQTGNVGEGVFKDRAEKARYVSAETFQRLRCTEIFPGDCLISRLPDPVGRACIIPDTGEAMITAVDCTIVRFREGVYLPEFFAYYSQSVDYLTAVDAETTGTTRKRISRARLGKVAVPLPPVPEQRRIVDILDEAFEAIATAKANTEKNLQSAREVFTNHVKSVFANPPHGWVECALGSVCEMYQPKTITGKELVPDGPYPVFGANGVIGRFTSYNHEEAEVLVTCRGATCGAINVSEPRSWVTGNAMVVRPLDGSLDKSFLEHMLRNGVDLSPAITGAAQPQITRTNLSPLMISFPKSVSEQRDLAAAFDDLKSASDSLHEISSRKITALDELKKSLLQQAFTGQLTAKSTDQRLEAVA